MNGSTRSGHNLAAEQLAALEAVSRGAVEVIDDTGEDGGLVVSLDTSTVPSGPGIAVRSRERFRLLVPATFPFRPPHVFAEHRRWAKTPHVNWGRVLCLYASISVEWVPAEGIRGLIERLSLWLERAAAGDLDPEDQPLHPPVTYTDDEAGIVVVRADLADRVPWTHASGPTTTDGAVSPAASAVLFAWCRRDGERLDVVQWCNQPEMIRLVLDEEQTGRDEHGRHVMVAPAVLVDDQIGWEFPEHARDLTGALRASGIDGDRLLDAMAFSLQLNRYLRLLAPPTNPAIEDGSAITGSSIEASTSGDPVVVLLGTPGRRVDGARLAHLVAWRLEATGQRITRLLADVERLRSGGGAGRDAELDRLDDDVRDLAREWLDSSKVRWSRVYELRAEVTRRRDGTSAISWLRSKRVLVLGAGALGAPVAEQVVRAGASDVLVVDSGSVTPGILVRQPFLDTDIGKPKAQVLAARLNQIDAPSAARSLVADVPAGLHHGGIDPSRFDLIIDATADVATRAALEHQRTIERDRWPTLVTMVIGHQARRGMVTVSLPGATGAGHDLLRRVAIAGRGQHQAGWGDVTDDLFPAQGRRHPFSPEPGCSAPTFVGSASEVTALGAQMLTRATAVIYAAANQDTARDPGPTPTIPPAPMTAIAVRLTPDVLDPTYGRDTSTSTLSWDNDLCTREQSFDYELRVAPAALAEMLAETRRGRRVRGPRVETGGMLLGSFDEATGVITVDLATGPSPDSRLSEAFFDHGVEGTREIVAHHRARSGDQIGFAGLWHTHPYGPARPSAVDERGIATLTGLGRRAVMLILAGPAPVWERWCQGTAAPELYARAERAADPTAGSTTAATDAARIGLPAGVVVFRGGFTYPTPVSTTMGTSSGSARGGAGVRGWRRATSWLRSWRSKRE